MSDHEWYYIQGGDRTGPVTGEALSDLASAGVIRPQDLIWCAAMPEWAAAATIPGLFEVPIQPQAVQTSEVPFIEYQSHRPSRTVYAGFWARFCAWFIDSIIEGSCVALVGLPLDALIRSDSAMLIVGRLLGIVVPWIYEALMESSAHQATLGKKAMGIKVTTLNGDRISFANATGRHFGKYLSALTLCVGFLMAGFTRRKQALHDMIASTLVVRK